MPKDPTFGINKFGKTRIFTESETLVFNILMVLINKPGFLPSLPEIGMNIQQYLYGVESDMDIDTIKAQLTAQCADFSEVVNNGSFDIVKRVYNGNPCLIFILPVVITDKYQNLVLSVSLNSVGEMIYNYTFGDIQTL